MPSEMSKEELSKFSFNIKQQRNIGRNIMFESLNAILDVSYEIEKNTKSKFWIQVSIILVSQFITWGMIWFYMNVDGKGI